MKFVFICFVVIIVFMTIISGKPALRGRNESSSDLESVDVICKQQMKRGQCRALIPRWMYDVKRGVCIEFKYGGCGGNSNNFKSKRDCEDTCRGVRY